MDTSTESNDYPEKDKKCEDCNDDQKFTNDEFDKHLLIVHNEICFSPWSIVESIVLRVKGTLMVVHKRFADLRAQCEKFPFRCPVENCPYKFNSKEAAEKYFLEHLVIHHGLAIEEVIKNDGK